MSPIPTSGRFFWRSPTEGCDDASDVKAAAPAAVCSMRSSQRLPSVRAGGGSDSLAQVKSWILALKKVQQRQQQQQQLLFQQQLQRPWCSCM
mmetsp:Transcript_109338/g.348943  ORF Transcript_109338/g.348943 Transcript_109338/m.348943 type:complete len:92 (-) Transcript_109338:180-455(-)